MAENTTVEETPEETPSVTSKIKSFAKKYWKPVAAGAAVTAAAVGVVAHFRNSDEEDENYEVSEEELQELLDQENSTETPEK